MPDEGNILGWFAATRALHFGACLIVMTIFVFERFIVAPEIRAQPRDLARRWQAVARLLAAVALPLVFVSGALWFGAVASDMSGLPFARAIRGQTPGIVWNQTRFGNVWKLRTALALCDILCVASALFFRVGSSLQAIASWAAMLSGAALTASLAWAGHGQTGGPLALHLGADVSHLLVAGCWPAGLLPLTLLMISLRKSQPAFPQCALPPLVRRFSTMALWSVGFLAASGAINAWFLVGTPSALLNTRYGLVLLAKVMLFCLMIALGAVNLLRHKPRLSIVNDPGNKPPATRLLRNVVAEVILAAAVLAATGTLGLLPPPAEHMGHQHHPQ